MVDSKCRVPGATLERGSIGTKNIIVRPACPRFSGLLLRKNIRGTNLAGVIRPELMTTALQCLALPCTSFDMTSEQSRQRLADFGCFMRVAHRNAPDYGIYGLLDFWQIFGKLVF